MKKTIKNNNNEIVPATIQDNEKIKTFACTRCGAIVTEECYDIEKCAVRRTVSIEKLM